MFALPIILLIDNNPVSEKIIEKTLAGSAEIIHATNVQQAAEAIGTYNIQLILINADTYSINAAITCAWLKGDPNCSELTLVVIGQNIESAKELKYLQAGASEVIELPSPQELLKYKILRHTNVSTKNAESHNANASLNHFYESTYQSTVISQCLTECLNAFASMNLSAALHICEHPELTCSSFGVVNEYEKELLQHAREIQLDERSGRFAFGDETLSLLVQDLPNPHHPLYESLIDWAKKIFAALSYKIRTLLPNSERVGSGASLPAAEETPIPKTAKGAQRLHYYVERALHQMEVSCEHEINRSLATVEALTDWPVGRMQLAHIASLKDTLLRLKETLMTNCLEIESRYLQFITERRATSRLNLGW